MPLEEKRLYYECGNDYVTLDQVQPWPDYVKENYWSFARNGIINDILYHENLVPFCTMKNSILKNLSPLNSPLFIY